MTGAPVVRVTHNLSDGLICGPVVVQVAGRWVSDDPRIAITRSVATALLARVAVGTESDPLPRQVATIAAGCGWSSAPRAYHDMLTSRAVRSSSASRSTWRAARTVAGAMLL